MPTLPSASLRLDAKTERRLLRLTATRQQSADTLVREAVEQYVEREEHRERLRHDAVAAWTEYQATGQHVTGEEADAWLSPLQAGEDVDPPFPHFLAAEAITEHLGVNEWQISGITQAINSLDRGEGVSHDQVKDWVSSWGNESEKPIPKRS